MVILKFQNSTNGELSLENISGYTKAQSAEPPYVKKLEQDVLQINSKPIYPKLNLTLGSFAVNLPHDSSLIIDVFTYEYHGITIQRFVFRNGNISKSPYNFTPYLYLEH